MIDSRRLAEAVRAACIKAALAAYEDGGVLGLCAEGRWEYAISALQQLDVDALIVAHAMEAAAEVADEQSARSSTQPL
ncbi:MAG: acetyltransferase [Candidatus Competibacter sp.]|nr:acetyltransferase [Candidatus Competibacter sp.]